MLFVTVGKDGKSLVQVCKNCNTTNTMDQDGTLCLSETLFQDDGASAHALADASVKHDPTLPRVTNVVCPRGEACPGHNKQQEVIYIKHNPVNMRYLYFCCHCDNFWRI